MTEPQSQETQKKSKIPTSWAIPPANEKLYQANLEALGPELAKLIEESPETPIAIDPDVKIDGLKNPTYAVVIGFSGMGVIDAIRNADKEISNILVIEPSLSVFKQTLKRAWIADLAKQENVDLLVGIPPEGIMPHLYKIFTHYDKKGGPRTTRCMAPEIVTDPFVYGGHEDRPAAIAEQLTKCVLDASKQVFLSMGCSSDSHFRWEQMIRNEKNLDNSYRIKPLFGKFEDKPVIVVGAGPSMKEFIDAYYDHKLGDRCLIVACDAALKKLLEHNIRPHLVTRCERKLTTIFNGIKREDTAGIFYAAYPWCPPEYFDLFERSFMLFRDNGVCKWTGYDPGSVNGGVSSANAGLELAYLFGAKQIILTGVDLCFLEGRSHVEGTEVEFDPEKSKAKWSQIPGNSNAPVTTIPVWFRCLNEYVGTIHKHQGQAHVYNTSLGGARIEGTEVRSWAELGDRGVFRPASESPEKTLEKYLEKHPPGYNGALQERKAKTVKFLKEVVKELDKLFLFTGDALLTARREEEKTVSLLKSYVDPKEFFDNTAAIRSQLVKVFEEPCRQIDNFKKKYYVQEQFSQIILDICQLDLNSTENKCYGLKNTVALEHERQRLYCMLHLALYKTYHFYATQLIELLETGKAGNPSDYIPAMSAEEV